MPSFDRKIYMGKKHDHSPKQNSLLFWCKSSDDQLYVEPEPVRSTTKSGIAPSSPSIADTTKLETISENDSKNNSDTVNKSGEESTNVGSNRFSKQMTTDISNRSSSKDGTKDAYTSCKAFTPSRQPTRSSRLLYFQNSSNAGSNDEDEEDEGVSTNKEDEFDMYAIASAFGDLDTGSNTSEKSQKATMVSNPASDTNRSAKKKDRSTSTRRGRRSEGIEEKEARGRSTRRSWRDNEMEMDEDRGRGRRR